MTHPSAPAALLSADRPRRPAQTSLTVALDPGQADRFRAWSRVKGGVSAALRQLVGDALGDGPPLPKPGPGMGRQVGVRLREGERAALAAAAAERGMTPSGWLRALACAHLLRRPRWNAAELAAVRDVAWNLHELQRALGAATEQLEAAARMHPNRRAEQVRLMAEIARDAAEAVRAVLPEVQAAQDEVQRLAALGWEYWGVPANEPEEPRQG